MTPREVIPAEISEEVEAEVSTALHKMVADERRYAGMAMNKRLLDGHVLQCLVTPIHGHQHQIRAKRSQVGCAVKLR